MRSCSPHSSPEPGLKSCPVTSASPCQLQRWTTSGHTAQEPSDGSDPWLGDPDVTRPTFAIRMSRRCPRGWGCQARTGSPCREAPPNNPVQAPRASGPAGPKGWALLRAPKELCSGPQGPCRGPRRAVRTRRAVGPGRSRLVPVAETFAIKPTQETMQRLWRCLNDGTQQPAGQAVALVQKGRARTSRPTSANQKTSRG